MVMYAEERLKICNSCEFNLAGDCALCGCVIADKVQKLEESCPLTPPKWSSGTTLSQAQIINNGVCVPCTKR